MTSRVGAPAGDLSTFTEDTYTDDDRSFGMFRKGSGPAVIVITEMPGITPQVLGFADRLVDMGLSVVLPDLFGKAGRDPAAESKFKAGVYTYGSILGACISREFTAFATGKSSRVVDSMRRLAASEHERWGGPGVGVIGMCFTGGFALAMATESSVIAPVLSQPSLPLGVGKKQKQTIDCSAEDIETVRVRCAVEGMSVLGLRFKDDPYVPEGRFEFLKKELGDHFVAVELNQEDGMPDGPLPHQHSVVTAGLIDEPGEPTRDALDQVLNLFQSRLLD